MQETGCPETIMTAEQHLKRILSLALPLVNWRVPVAFHHGRERVSGRPATLLIAGQERVTGYIPQRFFEEEPELEPAGTVPLWRLPAFLNRMQPSADLTTVCVDRLSARLFFNRGYLVSPAWIASWMPVPRTIEEIARQNKNAAWEIGTVRQKGYESTLSRELADFDLFYDRYYVPFIRERHGRLAHLRPRWALRRCFQRGLIIWIWRDGERVGGNLIELRDDVWVSHVLGVSEGRLDLLRERLVAAIYLHSTLRAMEANYTSIYLGGSRPSLHDGAFQYKRRWGAVVCAHLGSNHTMLLRWNRLQGPVAGFLSHTSIIHHDQGEFSALWCWPGNLPLNASRLRREIRAIDTPGLRRLRVLLPDKAPLGFECPPHIQLVDSQTVVDASPDIFQSLA